MAKMVMPRSRSSGLVSIISARHLLVGPKDMALFQKGVDEGRLAVVDMGNDSQVTDSVVLVVVQLYSPRMP